MSRAYIVIPEGTPIVVVVASSPHYAASKARRGMGERVSAADALVTASSATTSAAHNLPIVAGQLYWTEDGTIERA